MEENISGSSNSMCKDSRRKHKRIAVVESDSEEEPSHQNIQVSEDESICNDEQHSKPSIGKKGSKRILDSDSEDDAKLGSNQSVNLDDNNCSSLEVEKTLPLGSDYEDEIKSNSHCDAVTGRQSTKPSKPIEDLSDEEDIITPHNKSFSPSLNLAQAEIYSSSKSRELIPEESVHQQKSRLSALCDSESSEEEEEVEKASHSTSLNSFKETEEEDHIQPVPYKKKRSKKTEEPKPKKMTAKQAAQQRQEIRSESLKMLRESNIALPYHRPKSYTLKEFLQKRSSFSSALAVDSKTPPAVAIKMSRQQLEVISKKLKEREKEVEEFYKSESDSDNEETHTSEEVAEKEEGTSKAENIEPDRNSDHPSSISLPTSKNTGNINNETTDTLNSDCTHAKIIVLQNVVITNEQADNVEADSLENTDRTIESCKNAENSEDVIQVSSIKMNDEAHSTKAVEQNESRHGEVLNERQSSLESNVTETNKGGTDTEMTKQYEHCYGTESNENESIPKENTDGNTVMNCLILQTCPKTQTSEISDLNIAEEKETSKELQISSEKSNTLQIDGGKMEVDNAHITEQQSLENTENAQESRMDYTFNLDDVDDELNSSKELDDKTGTTENNSNKQLYCLDSFDGADMAAGKDSLTTVQCDNQLMLDDASTVNNGIIDREKRVAKKNSKLELLKERLGNIQPKLSGSPDEVIDLDSGVTRPNEVSQLIQRFMKHAVKKTGPKSVHLSIVSVTGGEVHKETVNMNIDQDEEPVAVMEKPGAKLQKLRDELQMQMAQKRAELWQKKKSQMQPMASKSTDEDEQSKCDAESEILDDEEEAELTDDDSMEDEEEYDEIDDCDIADKPRKKSEFVDDEADESEEDHEELENNEHENIEHLKDNESTTVASEEEDADGTEVTLGQIEPEMPKNKVLRRIIKPFADDTDDESSCDSLGSNPQKQEFKLRYDEQRIPEGNNEDEDIVPHQQPPTKTPQKAEPKSDLGFFLTPVSYLTGLQNLNSGSKYLRDSPGISPFQILDATLSQHENDHSALQKKLFQDVSDNTDSQQSSDGMLKQNLENEQDLADDPSTQELLGVCSGSFSGFSQMSHQGTGDTVTEKEIMISQPSTQDLLAVCSGDFSGITSEENLHKENFQEDSDTRQPSREDTVTTQDLLAVCSGSFTGIEKASDSQNNAIEAAGSATQIHLDAQNEETKELDEDQDQLISQLLDEDELEQFKKKFDSPPKKARRAKLILEGDEVVGSGAIIDSDDENESLEFKKKKKQKKLTFSDDESSNEEGDQSEEEIALNDDVDSDADDLPTNVEYDSEENEVEVNSEATKAYKLSDFVEKEAELSESDWDSEDEDEKDLDELEFEQADNEKFDEEQVKNDLEKIHMRRLLDDDTREVKLLQELLLEDGEMHGTGRQRQFRWKNIDSIGEENDEKKDDDMKVYFHLDEEETEEQWRKMRYQREMFLKEKRESQTFDDDDDILGESQVLAFGRKVIVKSQSTYNSQDNTPIERPKNRPNSPEVKQPLTLLNKKGSFLSRNEQVLKRLSEITKVETVQQIGASKKARNFVFQTVSIEDESAISETKKRKAEGSTPNVIKKLRITNLTPNNKRKSDQANKSRQLFNF